MVSLSRALRPRLFSTVVLAQRSIPNLNLSLEIPHNSQSFLQASRFGRRKYHRVPFHQTMQAGFGWTHVVFWGVIFGTSLLQARSNSQSEEEQVNDSILAFLREQSKENVPAGIRDLYERAQYSLKIKDVNQAITHYQDALNLNINEFGVGSEEVADCLERLAHAHYKKSPQSNVVLGAINESIRITKNHGGSDCIKLASKLLLKRNIHKNAGQTNKVIEVTEEALRILSLQVPDKKRQIRQIHIWLATDYEGKKKLASALDHRLAALEAGCEIPDIKNAVLQTEVKKIAKEINKQKIDPSKRRAALSRIQKVRENLKLRGQR